MVLNQQIEILELLSGKRWKCTKNGCGRYREEPVSTTVTRGKRAMFNGKPICTHCGSLCMNMIPFPFCS